MRVHRPSTTKAMANLNQTTVKGGSSLVMIFRIIAIKPHIEAVKIA